MGLEVECVGFFELEFEHRAGSQRDQVVCRLVDDIAEHDGGAVEPGGMPERAEVGHQVDVAVALFPVGELVSVDRFHFHVDRQQVVAAMCTVTDGVFEKEAGVESFSDQSAIEICEADQDGVDGPNGRLGLEFFECQTAVWLYGEIHVEESGDEFDSISLPASSCRAAESSATSSSGA